MVQPSKDVIQVERSIVASMKEELRLKVSPGATALIASGGTNNPESYEAYLRGHYLVQSTNGEQIKQGIEELRYAISLDPNLPTVIEWRSITRRSSHWRIMRIIELESAQTVRNSHTGIYRTGCQSQNFSTMNYHPSVRLWLNSSQL